MTNQPSFTQPCMYNTIAKQEPMLKKYMQHLVEKGSFTQSDIDEHQKWVWGMLEEVAKKSKSYQPKEHEWLSSTWEGFPLPKELTEKILDHKDTSINLKMLKHIGKVASLYPEDFSIHKNLRCILKMRGKMVEEGKNINMSTTKVLAFGSLVKEGYYVHLFGQDVKRGTFSQWHLVLHNQVDEHTYMLLQHIDKKQAPFVACNLSLSKFGCMGFKLGFLLVDPKNLTIWEVQFGNFANNMQHIINQFIASGERKWLQRTSLMLNLPHSYNGQGPKHSSMCIKHFLQLCDDHPFCFLTAKKNNHQHQDSNMGVVFPTMPANYFHMLQQQVHHNFCKLLIHFFSKLLLHHPKAWSKIKDFLSGTNFQCFIAKLHTEKGKDALVVPEHIKHHFLKCQLAPIIP
ncbi:2-oxoglutarate dehydrogenase E1 component [Thecaphora frezii]